MCVGVCDYYSIIVCVCVCVLSVIELLFFVISLCDVL